MSRREELLTAEAAGWRELEARIHRIPEDRWLTPGVGGGDWTPRDLVAHVACWHSEATRHLECIKEGLPDPEWPDTDAFNASARERCSEMTLKETLAMSGAARHRYLEELGQFPDAALSDRVTGWIGGNGEGHYAEHIPDLDAFLERS